MKTLYVFFGTLLLAGLLTTASLAQRSASRFTNYEAVTAYRIGTQGIGLSDLNQALQQAGYSPLATQIPMLSIASQFSRSDRPLAFHSEIGISFISGLTATNGTYKASAGFYYVKFGGSYRIIGTDRFRLAPQVSFVTLPFHMTVSQVSNAAPSLNAILTNPGSAQTATLYTSTRGIDAGLTANWKIPYSQRQYDCSTTERSVVIGIDAGYRFTGRAPLDNGHEISATNPAVQLSGWYAGIRLGIGTRTRSTASPVTN